MTYIKSSINFIGNKYKLLPQIIPLFPTDINTFVDVFGGSGTVTLNVKANQYVYNDICDPVTSIIKGIKNTDINDILNKLDNTISSYQLSKTNRNGFERLRGDYNNGKNNWITLYTLMCYSFNYQFRFNNNHQYNSSFGKDRSSFSKRQRDNLRLTKERLDDMAIEFYSCNFKDLLLDNLSCSDFVYLDPPYLNSVGNYNDGNRGFENWSQDNEDRLKEMILNLHNNKVRFALSNNLSVNPELKRFAYEYGFQIHHLSSDYSNSSYNKKITKQDDEVLITNY